MPLTLAKTFDAAALSCDTLHPAAIGRPHKMRIGRVGILHCAYCHRTHDQIKREAIR